MKHNSTIPVLASVAKAQANRNIEKCKDGAWKQLNDIFIKFCILSNAKEQSSLLVKWKLKKYKPLTWSDEDLLTHYISYEDFPPKIQKFFKLWADIDYACEDRPFGLPSINYFYFGNKYTFSEEILLLNNTLNEKYINMTLDDYNLLFN